MYVKVKTAAKQDTIGKISKVYNQCFLNINIKQIPEHGKANKAIIRFLSKYWKLSQDSMKIIQGQTSQYKVIFIKNIRIDHLKSFLNNYI